MAWKNLEARRKYSREYARRWRAVPANKARVRAAQHRYYHRQAAWQRRRRAALLAVIHAIKSVPCVDCAGYFPPVAMDFHHKDPQRKLRNVSKMIAGYSLKRILAEIDKCDVVCANCHRVRTARSRA